MDPCVSCVFENWNSPNDWTNQFIRVIDDILAGRDPYALGHTVPFMYPPWVIPIIFVLRYYYIFLPLVVLFWLAFRQKKPWLIPTVGLSIPWIGMLILAQIDWIILLGTVIGGPLGMLLTWIKPQGGGLSFIGDLRGKTIRQLALFFVPVALIVVISTLIYPGWINNFINTPRLSVNNEHNSTLLPWSIPFALYAIYRAWRDRSRGWGVVASVLLAPYFRMYSLVPLVYTLASDSPRAGILTLLGSWVYGILLLTGVLQS